MNSQPVNRGLHPKLADILAGGFILLLGLWLYFWAIPHYIVYKIKVPVLAPESFPSLFSLFMALLGLFLMSRSIVEYRAILKLKEHGAENVKSAKDSQPVFIKPIAFLVMLVGLIYIMSIFQVGFLLGTLILLLVMFKIYGGKKWWQGLVMGLCTTGILWWFFRIYLKVALPTGNLIGNLW